MKTNTISPQSIAKIRWKISKWRIIWALLIGLIINGCTEQIDMKVDKGETRLSVEASVTSDYKKQQVILKESSDVFYNQTATAVSNANIFINDGSTDYQYEEVKPGIYESIQEYQGDPGKTYQLNITDIDINKDGKMEEYHASATMREPYQIDSIQLFFDPEHESDRNDNGKGAYYLIGLYMKDDIKSKDFYAFASRINNILVHDTITELVVSNDIYFNGENTKGANVSEFDQSKPDEILKDMDTVTLESYAIDEGYYNFIEELQTMDEGQSMFSGPPGNISTNISNGAIGYFAVYSITRNSIRVKLE